MLTGRSHLIAGSILVGILIILALLRPLITAHDPLASDVDRGLSELGAPLPPSAAAPLGTDQLGRDVWARVVSGAGASLQIAALATALALAIGLAVGLVAGYAGGRVDEALMRLVDLVLAFPFLLLAILLAALLREAHLGSASAPVVVTLGVAGWTTIARVVRGKAMVIARAEYVVAARALGASPARIVFGHVLPNVAGVAAALAALGFAQNLLAEAVLGYLGLGAPPPAPTLGRMMFEGHAYYRAAPWLTIAPGLAIVVAVAGFQLLGEGLRARFAVVALVLLVSCAPADRGPQWRPAGNARPRDGGTLHVAVKEQISTLDPLTATDEVSLIPVHALFDTLVDFAPGGQELVPQLAERWEVSPDGRVVTFTLREGLRYSDGTAVAAQDFVFSLDRARTSPASPYGAFLADLEQATAPSARELVLHLARPNAAILAILAMPFTTPQRADHIRTAGEQLRRDPLGTGPFALASWDEGQHIVLRRNPHYWDTTRAHVDAIELRENVPGDTQFQLFERGELDAMHHLAAPDYIWIGSQPAWAPYVLASPTLNAFGSRMNVRRRPFSDRRVRQAFNYALDKQHSVKLLNGAALPAHGVLPPGMLGRDSMLPPYPHDVAKARALLAEAGYPSGLDVEYVVQADDEAERLAGSLQHDLGEAGIRVHLSVMAFATYAAVLTSERGSPFAKAAWVADFPDPANFMDASFHSRAINPDGSTNFSFYANPELDRVLDAARAERDTAARATLYRQAERIVYDDAPWLFDYHQVAVELVQPYVRGFTPHPVRLHDYTRVWLDVDAAGRRVPR